jgi:hypothetical protein
MSAHFLLVGATGITDMSRGGLSITLERARGADDLHLGSGDVSLVRAKLENASLRAQLQTSTRT